MVKLIISFVLVLSIQVNSDLIDEAKQKVQQLRNLVLGEILVNFGKIDSIVQDLHNHHELAISQAQIDINTEYQSFQSQLFLIKEEFESKGIDITECYEDFMSLLENLEEGVLNTLTDCTNFADGEIDSIEESANYRLNIITSDVEFFDYQLDRCMEETLCILPIVTEIEKAMVTFPEKVQVEISRAVDLAENLKPLVDTCINSKITFLASQGRIVTSLAQRCKPTPPGEDNI